MGKVVLKVGRWKLSGGNANPPFPISKIVTPTASLSLTGTVHARPTVTVSSTPAPAPVSNSQTLPPPPSPTPASQPPTQRSSVEPAESLPAPTIIQIRSSPDELPLVNGNKEEHVESKPSKPPEPEPSYKLL